jgi:predicted DsbA family dithiol-disulfide isomerase
MVDDTLIRLRETAAAYAEAVRETQRYFDRVEDLDDPAVLVEYANLVSLEERAAAARLDVLEEAGVVAPSIDNAEP